VIANVFLLNENRGFLAIWRGCRRLCQDMATEGCANIKILIESEQKLLLVAALFLLSGKDVSSLKTGNNHEHSKSPQAQGGICVF
jgi:hypothetical protein